MRVSVSPSENASFSLHIRMKTNVLWASYTGRSHCMCSVCRYLWGMEIRSYPLDGKLYQLVTQLISMPSQYYSKKKRTVHITYVQWKGKPYRTRPTGSTTKIPLRTRSYVLLHSNTQVSDCKLNEQLVALMQMCTGQQAVLTGRIRRNFLDLKPWMFYLVQGFWRLPYVVVEFSARMCCHLFPRSTKEGMRPRVWDTVAIIATDDRNGSFSGLLFQLGR